jgi:hypothetical protein
MDFRSLNVRYLISMPERTLRFTAAGAGGFIYEATVLLLPGWLRRIRLYTAIIALPKPGQVDVETKELDWECSERRALAAKSSLRGVVLRASAARETLVVT